MSVGLAEISAVAKTDNLMLFLNYIYLIIVVFTVAKTCVVAAEATDIN